MGLRRIETAILDQAPESSEEALQQLAALELLAQSYFQKAEENPEEEESWLGLAEETYELLAKIAGESAFEDLWQRSAWYDALRTLLSGDEMGAKDLLEGAKALPEAQALLDAMASVETTQAERETRDRRRLSALALLDLWSTYADEGEAYELDQAKGVLGVAMGTIRYYTESGNKTMIDHVGDKWKLDRDLIQGIQEKIQNDEAETVQGALGQIAESSGPFQARAQTLLEEQVRKDNSGSYLLAHLIQYVSEDQSDPKQLQRLLKDADESSARMNAAATPYAIYSFLKATEGEEAIKSECESRLTDLEKGKELPGIVWDMIRTTGTDDLVQLAIMAGASKAGSLARLAALSRLEKAGVSGYKALALAYGANIAVEGTAMWAMNTVYESLLHDTDKVFEGKKLLKSWGANLVMIAGLKGAAGLGAKGSPPVAHFLNFVREGRLSGAGIATVWGLNHLAGLGGMIATTQLNQVLGLSEAPKGGLKESLAHDVFTYIKYGIAQKGVDNVLGRDFVLAREGRRVKIRELESRLLVNRESSAAKNSDPSKGILRGEASILASDKFDPIANWLQQGIPVRSRGWLAGSLGYTGLALMLNYISCLSPASHGSSVPEGRALPEIQPIERKVSDKITPPLADKPQGPRDLPATDISARSISSNSKPGSDLPKYNSAEKAAAILSHSLLAPFWMMMGVGGLGGSGKSRKGKVQLAKPDARLIELDNQLAARQVKDPKDSKIHEDWAVIADYLQQKGDSRGEWISLELERQRLLAQGDPSSRLNSIETKIARVRSSLNKDLKDRFGPKLEYDFEVGRGFRVTIYYTWDSNSNVPRLLRQFAESEYRYLLRSLSLHDDRPSPKGVPILAQMPHFPHLQTLDLSGNEIHVSETRALAQSQNFRQLKYLDLHSNYLKSKGAQILAQSPHFPLLQHLDLRWNSITDAGFEALTQSPNFPNLQSLDLSGNDVGVRGIRALAEAPYFPNLQRLSLRHHPNDLSFKEIQLFKNSHHLPNLIELNGRTIKRPPPDRLYATAAPVIPMLETIFNGHPSLLGILAAGGALLATNPAMLGGLWNPFKGSSRNSAPIDVLSHPLLGPFWTMMGVDGFGGSKAWAKKKIQLAPADSRLSQLNLQLSELQTKRPRDSKIQEYWALIADALQEKGDPRGEWIALEQERQRLLGQGKQDPKLASIEKKIGVIRQNLNKDIRRRFGDKTDQLELDFNAEKGFGLILRSLSDPYKFLEQFSESEYPYLLRSLDLPFQRIGHYGARVLAQSPNFTHLQFLNLSDTGIGTDGAQAIAQSRQFPHLQSLNLAANRIGEEGVQALAQSKNFPHLQSLDLSSNGIGGEGVKAIFQSPNFPHLISLELAAIEALGHLPIGMDGIRAIAESKRFPHLQRLDLAWNDIGDEGMRILAQSPNFPHLLSLNLMGINIGTDGIRAIAESSNFPQLQYLNIAENEVGIPEARILANSRNFAQLQHLEIEPDFEVEHFIQNSEHLPSLILINGEPVKRR